MLGGCVWVYGWIKLHQSGVGEDALELVDAVAGQLLLPAHLRPAAVLRCRHSSVFSSIICFVLSGMHESEANTQSAHSLVCSQGCVGIELRKGDAYRPAEGAMG